MVTKSTEELLEIMKEMNNMISGLMENQKLQQKNLNLLHAQIKILRGEKIPDSELDKLINS
tara:strand:+ start:1243 stop:1425 length:183 start_codon:yes stop_codon:yes gene_type:complete